MASTADLDFARYGITPMMLTCDFTIIEITDDTVFLVDEDQGGMSVTNATELVTAMVNADFPDRRIIYRDSDGRWDELLHRAGCFRGFRPVSP